MVGNCHRQCHCSSHPAVLLLQRDLHIQVMLARSKVGCVRCSDNIFCRDSRKLALRSADLYRDRALHVICIVTVAHILNGKVCHWHLVSRLDNRLHLRGHLYFCIRVQHKCRLTRQIGTDIHRCGQILGDTGNVQHLLRNGDLADGIERCRLALDTHIIQAAFHAGKHIAVRRFALRLKLQRHILGI